MALSEAADMIPNMPSSNSNTSGRLPDGTVIVSNHNSGRGVTSEIRGDGNLITRYLPEGLKKYNFLETILNDKKVQGAFLSGVVLGCLAVRILKD